MRRMTDHRVAVGDVLARKYRVERVLAKGNMGVVVAATHVDLGQLLAVKMMLPDTEQTPELRERFMREARAAVRLKSQHVARVVDVGIDEHDAPYMAMEYLEGQDLADTLKARGPLPFDEAVEFVLQACEAVGEAHALGIVHRDLKPANLFLTKDVSGAPCVKVLDFGISKLSGAELTLTQEAQALGSPLYMSPEAMGSAKHVDARTDIWALGIILYQLVAGRTPFHETTMAQLCNRILFGTPTPLADLRPDAPPGFEAIILRCLEREREKRFDNVAAFAGALLPYTPARARIYIERISRVVGVEPAPMSLPSGTADTQPGVGPRAPMASVPAMAAAGASSNAGFALPSSQSSLVLPRVESPVKRSNRAPLIAGAILIFAIPLVFVVRAWTQPTQPTQPTNAVTTTSPEAAVVAAPPPPVTHSVVLPVAPMQSADVLPDSAIEASPSASIAVSANTPPAVGPTTKATTKATTKGTAKPAPTFSLDERR
jgi:serine/threonine protein kinase